MAATASRDVDGVSLRKGRRVPALAPMLAESWTPNDDGSVWTFKIRQGVKWHSGTDFTSADVVGALDRLAPTNLAAYIDPGSAKALDDVHGRDHLLKTQTDSFRTRSRRTTRRPSSRPPTTRSGRSSISSPTVPSAFKLDTYDVAYWRELRAVRRMVGWQAIPRRVEIIFSDDIATQIYGLLGGQADAVIQFWCQRRRRTLRLRCGDGRLDPGRRPSSDLVQLSVRAPSAARMGPRSARQSPSASTARPSSTRCCRVAATWQRSPHRPGVRVLGLEPATARARRRGGEGIAGGGRGRWPRQSTMALPTSRRSGSSPSWSSRSS